MIRKDFVLFEIQKIAQALARILGFKKEGELDEAQELADSTISEYFSLTPDKLDTMTPEGLINTLDLTSIHPEKLQLLADLLFESVHPFEDTQKVTNRLHLVLAIHNTLEEVHHVQSLNNLARREFIDKFLNNAQYE
jgi:hypothetical protein